MTSKKPDDASPSENDPSTDPSTDAQSPEVIAAAAIAAAKAASGADSAAANDDPLNFEDARMPDADTEISDEAVDLSGDDAEAADGNDLSVRLAEAEATAAAHLDRVMRLQADMENERKRSQKQVANAHKFAIEGFVDELLPIKDSLEMGLKLLKALS